MSFMANKDYPVLLINMGPSSAQLSQAIERIVRHGPKTRFFVFQNFSFVYKSSTNIIQGYISMDSIVSNNFGLFLLLITEVTFSTFYTFLVI